MDEAKNSTLESSMLATGQSSLVIANLSCLLGCDRQRVHPITSWVFPPLYKRYVIFQMCLINLEDIKMFQLAGWVTYIFVKLNSLQQNVTHSLSGTELMPFFIQTFARHISSARLVRRKSAVMKDDICDKRTDHKLSNHSRTCLLAASTVTLCTLSPLRVRTTPAQCGARLPRWTHSVRVHFDGS